jgi:LPS export ABC transporter protein LptC
MTLRPFLLLLVMLGLLATGFWSLWQVRRPTPGQPSSAGDPRAPEKQRRAQGQDVTFVITQDGRKTWELKAQQAEYLNAQQDARLTGVTGLAFSSEADPTKPPKPMIRFTAPRGLYRPGKKQIELYGGVLAQQVLDTTAPQTQAPPSNAATGRFSIQAPTVKWQVQSTQLEALGGVTMQLPSGGRSQAQTARFSLDFSKVVLAGGAITQVMQ